MKRNLVFLSLFVALFAVSCKKDGGTTPPPAADPYMTTTANSTWDYRLQNNKTSTNTDYTLTATSNDSAINGRPYRILVRSDNGSHEYYNKNGSDYYNFQDLGASLGNNKVDILYLKDNVAAAGTWEQSFSLNFTGFPFPVPAKLSNTVTEKGISRIVNGITYTNVIHVTNVLSSTLVPAANLTTDIHSYYAPKVGNIETTYKLDLVYSGLTAHIDTKLILLSADIK